MFPKKSLFAVFIILSLYVLGMILSFTGDFIQHFQYNRHQYQIEKIASAKILEFSIDDWKKFNDSKEIHFQSDFYDVISIEKKANKIFAKVVKDDFENDIRVTFSQIFNKHKTPISEKKKTNSIAKHLNSKLKFHSNYAASFYFEKNSNFDLDTNLKVISFIDLPIKPPC